MQDHLSRDVPSLAAPTASPPASTGSLFSSASDGRNLLAAAAKCEVPATGFSERLRNFRRWQPDRFATLSSPLMSLKASSSVSSKGQPRTGSISAIEFSSKWSALRLGKDKQANGKAVSLFLDSLSSVRLAKAFILLALGTAQM